MATEQIPITRTVLAWARERSGISLDEAASRFHHIREWETGDAFPTYPQLERLAEYYHLPIAVFFFPEPPELPDIEETFRTLQDADIDQLPPKIRHLLRRARAFQLNLAELHNDRNPAERLITRDILLTPDQSAETLAGHVRNFLGIPIDTQITWNTPGEALEEWRHALLNSGIYVFKDAFGVDGYFGFSLYDENFPIIYVNNSSTKTRQIFTLAHELAHLLFHTSGVDGLAEGVVAGLPQNARAIEVWCNRFASVFLLPEAELNIALRDMEPSEATAERLANRYNLSREVIFRRLLDRGLISAAEYRDAVDRWNAQRRRGGSGGDWYWTQLSYLGRDYVSLAFQQYHQNRISESQLGDYLETKPKNLPTLESYFLKGGG